jgi:O-antigen/teichoic acid export membrane protein
VNYNQESSVGSKIREASRHSIVYGLGSVAQSAVGFVLLPIMTGALTPSDFGVYSLILMASAISSGVFYLGMTSALSRSYFDYVTADDRRAVFTTAFMVLVVGALIQIALGYFGGRLISNALVGIDQYANSVAWAFFCGAITFINSYFLFYLRILRKSITSVVFSLISLPGGVGLTLFFLSITPASISAPFQAIALSQLAITIIFVVWFGKHAFVFRIQRNELSRILPYGLSMVIASFGSVLLDWMDRVIIEHFMTLSDVGNYSAAFRVGALINVILILPFSQIWSPMMMEYRSHSNVKKLSSLVLSYYLVVGALILIPTSIFISEILNILIRSGNNDGLSEIVLLVMLGTLIYGTTNIVAAGLLYERQVHKLNYAYYPAATLKLGVNILLVPIFGLLGAAVTALAASAMIPIGIYMLGRKYFTFKIEWKRICIISINCSLPIIYGMFYSPTLNLTMPVRIVWTLFACLIVYLTCLSSGERSQLKLIAKSIFLK